VLTDGATAAADQRGVGITPWRRSWTTWRRGERRPVTVAHADRSAASHALFGATADAISALGSAEVHTWYERVDATGDRRVPGQG
jgi:nitric oxide dioxygenase